LVVYACEEGEEKNKEEEEEEEEEVLWRRHSASLASAWDSQMPGAAVAVAVAWPFLLVFYGAEIWT
jgi:hypothetical protein